MMGMAGQDRSLRGRWRTKVPGLERYASMSAVDRDLAKHAQMLGGLEAIYDELAQLRQDVVTREQQYLPFRIEEEGQIDLATGELDIQPQTTGLQEVRTILVTCQLGVPADLTLFLDNEHTLYLTGANALADSTYTLTQQELLIHSATRKLTWTPGLSGNKLNCRITGKAIPQLKGRREI